jgi:four helix bundle protein
MTTSPVHNYERSFEMRPHEKLDVWKKAMDLVLAVYRATSSLPMEEKFGLTSQIRRAAVSIPANIAEGAARQSPKEFAHFLSTAQGSASELETELLIAHRLGYLDVESYGEMRSTLDSIGRMIVGLALHVRRKAR